MHARDRAEKRARTGELLMLLPLKSPLPHGVLTGSPVIIITEDQQQNKPQETWLNTYLCPSHTHSVLYKYSAPSGFLLSLCCSSSNIYCRSYRTDDSLRSCPVDRWCPCPFVSHFGCPVIQVAQYSLDCMFARLHLLLYVKYLTLIIVFGFGLDGRFQIVSLNSCFHCRHKDRVMSKLQSLNFGTQCGGPPPPPPSAPTAPEGQALMTHSPCYKEPQGGEEENEETASTGMEATHFNNTTYFFMQPKVE